MEAILSLLESGSVVWTLAGFPRSRRGDILPCGLPWVRWDGTHPRTWPGTWLWHFSLSGATAELQGPAGASLGPTSEGL